MNFVAIWLEIRYSWLESSCKESVAVQDGENCEETLNNFFAIFLSSADIRSCLTEPFTMFQ
jgi:hypothetical protein